MKEIKSARDVSKDVLGFSSSVDSRWTCDVINTGSLQRIADACELMAKNWQDLVEERDRYKLYYENRKVRCNQLECSNRALRGAITRMKRRAK